MLRAVSFCLISMLTCATDTLFAQGNKPTSGTDVIVSPTSGNYYSQARVSVSYDSTIYIGRLYRAGGPGRPQNMEVLKTTDYGQNFTVVTSAAVTGSTRYSNIDIITAGAGPGNFRLFVAYSTYDTATDNVVLRLDTLDENGNGGAMINELYVQTNNPFFRGVESISLATDWREPAASSSSFAVTMAVAKVGSIFDSVVVFTSSTEGPGYTRQPLQNTLNYIKNVSVSLGTNQHSDTAIACVAWDEYGVLPDEYGAIRCRYVNAANGADVPLNQGVLDAAADVNIYRKPCVVMSWNTSQSEAGPGTSDLRTAITFEYNNGSQAGVRGVINDSVLTGQVTFMSPYYFSAPGTLIEPHGVYDNLADTFRMTYYDTTGKTLVYDKKAANSTATTDFININPNYRDATGAMELPVAPRMDFSPANNMAVLVWNDNGLTMLDTQYVVQPLFVNAVATSTRYELYPNPSVGTISCLFAAAAEEQAVLSVCDMRGAELIRKDISIRAGSNTVSIAAGELPAGNYILKIKGSLSNVCGKFGICD